MRAWKIHQWKARSITADRSLIQPSAQAIAARSDLGLLGQYVAGYLPAAHHKEWFPHLRTGESNEAIKEYAGIHIDQLAPRGSAKSTWAAIATADFIGHNPHAQILYLSHSRDIALRQSRKIKRIIESPQYQEVFPHIRPNKHRWAHAEWEIDKIYAGVNSLDSDFTLKSYGILGSVIGGRFHLIMGDDLIKSSKSIKNAEVREDMIGVWEEVIEECLIPGGRIWVVGTRFRRDDIHASKFDKDDDYQVLTTSALKNEQSYWPERIKTHLLLKVREKKPLIFLYQHQNQIPPDDQDVTIKPSWIRWGELPEKSTFSKLVLGCDLAATENQNNNMTAFVLVGLVKNPFHLWVIQSWYGWIEGNVDKLLLVKFIKDEWGDFELVPETNAYQRSLLGDFRTIFVNQWGIRNIRVTPSPSKGDKEERLEGISGQFANGFVTFNKNAINGNFKKTLKSNETKSEVKFSLGLGLLVQQLTNQVEGDDLSDACEKAIARLQGKNKEVWSG